MCDLYTGCVVFSGLWPTPHTLVGTYQSGALLLIRVESPISQHTAVLLGGGELPARDGFAVRLSCVEPSEAALVANSYEYCTHSSTHINRRLCCWSGWSRLYRRTQQSYWVVWSRAARNVFFVDGGVRFSYRCFRDKKQNNRRLNQSPIRTGT